MTHACCRLKCTAKYGNSDTTTEEDQDNTRFSQFPLELASTNESALLAKAGYTNIDKSRKASNKSF